MRQETIFVDRDGVKVMINKSDFDPQNEKEWSEGEDKPTKRAYNKKTVVDTAAETE